MFTAQKDQIHLTVLDLYIGVSNKLELVFQVQVMDIKNIKEPPAEMSEEFLHILSFCQTPADFCALGSE